MQTTIQSLLRQIADALDAMELDKPSPTTDIETACVGKYGEFTTKANAAKMLGIGNTRLYSLISDGFIPTASDGRVIVREAIRYFYQPEEVKKQQKRMKRLKGSFIA